MSAARGCSPTARRRSPTGVRKSTIHATISSTNESQIIRLRSPIASPKNDVLAEARDVHVRDARQVARRAVLAVDLDEEVARDAEREEVDRRAADDLVGAQVDREERVQEREAGARDRRDRGGPSPTS